MRSTIVIGIVLAFIPVTAVMTHGHFGMVIPSDNMVMQDDDRTLALELSFSHPMEMVGMELIKPKSFFLHSGGSQQDLAND